MAFALRRRLPTALNLALAVLVPHGCSVHDSGPTSPSTANVNILYVPSPPASCSAPEVQACSGGCAHHGAPANLQASGSWGQATRLGACGLEASCGVLPEAPVGRELTLLVFDIAQCCRDCSTAARETVYANGTRLTRFLEGEGGRPGGLAFTIDRNGVVRP